MARTCSFSSRLEGGNFLTITMELSYDGNISQAHASKDRFSPMLYQWRLVLCFLKVVKKLTCFEMRYFLIFNHSSNVLLCFDFL